MSQKHFLLLGSLSLVGFANCVTAGGPIAETQARLLVPAVAKVTLQRASTTALLQECGKRFATLKSASQRARTQWLRRNHVILQKADQLHDRLWQSLKQQQSGITAETFDLNLNRLIQQSVQHERDRLAHYPPAQQHAICNHLILSVRAGDWDVSHKQAKAYATLENFH